MFRNLRVGKSQPHAPPPIDLSSISRLIDSAEWPISIRALNNLHQNIKLRAYRILVPPALLSRFEIDPITLQGPDKQPAVTISAEGGTGKVTLTACSPLDPSDPFLLIELSDNTFNGVDLNLIVVGDPASERFNTDRDEASQPTAFGTMGRNLKEEERAMQAGLAPGQTRAGLNASGMIFQHIETLLSLLGHRALGLEPLTYASAWVFERRGFAYVRGHKLMNTIHQEFQPGGRLHAALDGRSPFRQPEAWQTVRGRSWAIQDGVLAAIEAGWDDLRMVKQLGRDSGVETFPGAVY